MVCVKYDEAPPGDPPLMETFQTKGHPVGQDAQRSQPGSGARSSATTITITRPLIQGRPTLTLMDENQEGSDFTTGLPARSTGDNTVLQEAFDQG